MKNLFLIFTLFVSSLSFASVDTGELTVKELKELYSNKLQSISTLEVEVLKAKKAKKAYELDPTGSITILKEVGKLTAAELSVMALIGISARVEYYYNVTSMKQSLSIMGSGIAQCLKHPICGSAMLIIPAAIVLPNSIDRVKGVLTFSEAEYQNLISHLAKAKEVTQEIEAILESVDSSIVISQENARELLGQ